MLVENMPDKVLAQYSRKYPNAWTILERFFLSRGKDDFPACPPYVFVPVAGAYAVLTYSPPQRGGFSGERRVIGGLVENP